MDPSRKRKVRLGVALTVALLLAGGLLYTSFSAASEAKQPSQLLASANPDQSYDLTGKVVDDSVRREGDVLRFKVEDRTGDSSQTLPVRYEGTVPDPFREGREIILTGRLQDGTFVGDRDALITKCPSKFKNQPSQQGGGRT